MSILGMVLLAGSLDLNEIIHWQDRNHVWGILVQPIGFLLFLISAFAETNRLPFDLPESEQELVGGYHTEYSAMKFGMFFLGEYLHVITVSYLPSCCSWRLGRAVPRQFRTGRLVLVVGQGRGDGGQGRLDDFLRDVGMLTLPRFRYDQLMDLAWKKLIPLALSTSCSTAVIRAVDPRLTVVADFRHHAFRS